MLSGRVARLVVIKPWINSLARLNAGILAFSLSIPTLFDDKSNETVKHTPADAPHEGPTK